MDAKQVETPEDRAEAALKNAARFCNLLADARLHRAAGWWDGSAFRSHPCGLIFGVIKMTNHWHVDDCCDIAVTDGEGWDRNVSNDSFGHGSPNPKPVGGRSIKIWDHGQWASPGYEQTMKPRIMSILVSTIKHIDCVKAEEARVKAQQEEERQQLAKAAAMIALAKATATPSLPHVE